MNHYSDTKLLSLITEGNRQAFEILISRYYDQWFHFALKRARNLQDAEDILQNTLIKIAENIKTFKQRSSFHTWVCRIIINTANDFFKSQNRKRVTHQAYCEDTAFWGKGSERNPDEQLWALVDQLPEKQHDAIFCVYGMGMSHKEVAETLNCAETTVSWRVFVAKKELVKKAKVAGLILILFLILSSEVKNAIRYR